MTYGKEELYDLDESPEPDKNNAANFRDDSADFNEFGGGGNEYNQQFGNNRDEVVGAGDMGANDADDEEDAIYQRDLADAQALADNSDDNFDGGDNETPQENFDGNDGKDEEEQEEENADGKEQGEGEQGNNGKQNTGGKVAAAGKEPDGPIKWKKGDEITLDLLYQVWSECKFIEKIKSLVDAANKAIMEAINTTGPNLALRLNDYISKVVDKNKDTIDCLLDLAKKNGKRMVFVATSVVEAFFTQQWLQTGLLATLPKVLQGAIASNPLKGILNSIFTVAVPIINKKAQNK